GDDHGLADPGADHVRRDDGLPRGVARERERPHEEEADPLERLLLLGRPDLADDAPDQHYRPSRGRGGPAGAVARCFSSSSSSTTPATAASTAMSWLPPRQTRAARP